MGPLGRRYLEFLLAAWNRIKDKNVTCVALAMLFSAVFVVPPILIFGDRSLPFQYGLAYSKSEFLHAGQRATNVFAIRELKKNCNGEFDRFFTDAHGNRFFLGTLRTSYMHGLIVLNGRRFEKDWNVPLGAEPGPGLYETIPRFWCNLVQAIYPIPADPVKIKVTILPN